MIPQPPPGQGPVDPRGAFSRRRACAGGQMPQPGQMPPGQMPPMPPMMMMPPPYYPPPPPPRGRSFAGAIFTTLATTILGVSILLNIILLVSNASSASQGIKEETIVDGSSSEQIAVIPIHGVIDDSMAQHFEKMISQAEKNSSVKAIVLDIDSPGGTVTSSDEIYARILSVKEKKHVVASICGLGASGAFYISCAADYVFAEKTSLTGSIGVIMPSYNVSKLIQSYGVEDTTITSDGATYKDAGSPTKPETDQDRAYFKSILNQASMGFKGIVEKSRKLPAGKIDEIANGKIYTADEASGFRSDRQDRLSARSLGQSCGAGGSDKQRSREIRAHNLVAQRLGDSKFTGGTPQSSVQINGINVNVDRNTISELLTPRPMYLWRGQ